MPQALASSPARPSVGRVCFLLMSGFLFLLILRNPAAATGWVGEGLTLCARVVVPSLFPSLVLSELLVSSGAGEALGRLLGGVMRRVFGVSGAGAAAVCLGTLCGFPVGAGCAVSLYDRGVISREECQHLFTFVNNPGSAFLISAVGVSLFGSRRLGVVLWGLCLGSGLAVGFAAKFFLRGKGIPREHPHFPSGLHGGGAGLFTGAVKKATEGMLTVCGFVLFFSAATGALDSVLGAAGVGEGVSALLCGLLELTGGMARAAALPRREVGLILTAALIGWSGLSVHGQVMSVGGGRGLSFRPYLLAKGAQGLLCGGLMALLLQVAPHLLLPPAAGEVDALALLVSLTERVIPLGGAVPAVITNGVFVWGWGMVLWGEEGGGVRV